MDIKADKLQLIEWLTQLNDSSIIDKIKAIKSQEESDWWNSLTPTQKQDIEAGLLDLESDRKYPFDEVMAKYK